MVSNTYMDDIAIGIDTITKEQSAFKRVTGVKTMEANGLEPIVELR